MCDWGKVECTHIHTHTRNFTLNCYVKEPVRWNFHTNLLYLYISHEGLWGETLKSRFRRSQHDSVPGRNCVQRSSEGLKCQVCVAGATLQHFVGTESRRLCLTCVLLQIGSSWGEQPVMWRMARHDHAKSHSHPNPDLSSSISFAIRAQPHTLVWEDKRDGSSRC